MQSAHAQTNFEHARDAYVQGNYTDSITALGHALHDAPLNGRWLDFLERIITDQPALMDAVPTDGQLSATTAAVRAYIDARTGNINRGLHLLAQVIHAMPDPRFVLWLPRWIDEDNAASVDTDPLNMLLSVTMNKYPDEQVPDPDEREAMQKLAAPVQLVRRANPDDARFEGLCFSFFHKTAQYDEMLVIVEETLARGILHRDEYYGGIYYLAWVLSVDPTNDRALARLDALITSHDDPVQLIDADQLDVPNAALLAYIQAQTGQLEAAATIMTQVVQHLPAQRYLPWVATWLEGLEAPSVEDNNRVFHLLLMIVTRLPTHHELSDTQRTALQHIIPTLEAFRDNQTDAMTQTLLSRAYRQLGRHDDALRVAQQAYDQEPSKIAAVFVAGAHRAKGDIDAAVDYFQKALEFAPDEVTILADLGDMLCERGDYAEGIAYYERALEIEPDHHWARPQALYYRYFVEEGNSAVVDELRAYVNQNPDNTLAQNLLNHLETLEAPYFRYLPSPAEASLNVFRDLLAQEDADLAREAFEITVSHPEAPSTYLAIRRSLETLDLPPDNFSVETETIPTPDPRQPLGEVPLQIWTYQHGHATPTYPEPDKNLRKVLARLAERPFNLSDWAVLAQQAATMEGTLARDHLLAVMTHPPKAPANIAAWDWVQRVQVAAALTIAFLDDGWEGSVRRETLVALLNGPMDWSITAAILALTYLAERDSDIAEDVLPLFEARRASIPTEGYTPYHIPLLHAMLRLPNLPAEQRPHLETALQALGG